jgi:hypothetical protein
MNIPSEEDWHSECWNVDTPYAYKHFFGKNLAEAFDLFVSNAICYQEDIMFMPLVCFRYYVHAYMDYLLSEKSARDSDGASCFFGIVEIRHRDILAIGEGLQHRVINVLRRLAARQQWYDADPDIYGDFAARTDEAIRLLER